MLVRPEQVNALGSVVATEFSRNMANLLVTHFSNARAEKPEVVRDFVQRQTARASARGFHSQRSAACYIVAAWVFGETFDETIDEVRTRFAEDESSERKALWLSQWSVEAVKTAGQGSGQ